MQKIVLPNGLTVIFEHKKGPSVVVQVMVKVGSNDEAPSERGLSHFIEHMVFEGTKKRPTNKEISNEIEKVGGTFNAYTSNERTSFFVKVLRKHFSLAIDVLSDIIQNPLFSEKDIQKEKKVVIKEIDMVNDEPRYYQWVLLQKNLFKEHPAKYPTYGEKKVIQNLKRQGVVDYYQKYYLPNNMVISIVGEVKRWKSEIEKRFILPKGKNLPLLKFKEPETKKDQTVKERKKITNTYCVMGFKTVPKRHPDAFALEIVNAILGRGQSGKMFNEIRSKRGLAYDVGTQNASEIGFGYFAVYASINKKNLAQVKELMIKELQKLKEVTEKELKEAKDFIEGNYCLEMEDPQRVADELLSWEQAKDAKLMKEYIKKIKKITTPDIKRAAERYFPHFTFVVIEGK